MIMTDDKRVRILRIAVEIHLDEGARHYALISLRSLNVSTNLVPATLRRFGVASAFCGAQVCCLCSALPLPPFCQKLVTECHYSADDVVPSDLRTQGRLVGHLSVVAIAG
ncbi:hypothetical protein AWC12_08695 [Mycolicibacterium iranicum]|uniref:Uncharacterized protein n=1 Tax=Mycolicibacterium iranicum TaxID=912594 RepID=A0A1X1WS65_MYCIR|nr:hypothetical protein AWC12_08695 [Mycolicibacterium iranicum]